MNCMRIYWYYRIILYQIGSDTSLEYVSSQFPIIAKVRDFERDKRFGGFPNQ